MGRGGVVTRAGKGTGRRDGFVPAVTAGFYLIPPVWQLEVVSWYKTPLFPPRYGGASACSNATEGSVLTGAGEGALVLP